MFYIDDNVFVRFIELLRRDMLYDWDLPQLIVVSFRTSVNMRLEFEYMDMTISRVRLIQSKSCAIVYHRHALSSNQLITIILVRSHYYASHLVVAACCSYASLLCHVDADVVLGRRVTLSIARIISFC